MIYNLIWFVIGFGLEQVAGANNRIMKISPGDLNETALNTMAYHRSMINEFLCRNYLVNDILLNLRNESIKKRIGTTVTNVPLLQESMLEDSGSRKYKDWLARSTTLEDIYRHYNKIPDEELQSSQVAPISDGEVTGYALLGDKAIGLTDFTSGFGYHHYDHFEEEDDHENKSVKLKEVFDLALTAIAFLAFGTFITETMIQGFGVQNQEAQMMIVSPMSGVNGISFKSNFEGMPLPKSEQRSAKENGSQAVLNEMSRKVLASIEALSVAAEDGGKCLRKSLCKINKYSRRLSGMQMICLSLWSFATGLIAEKFIKTDTYSLMENLKSSLFGFGNVDCEKFYGKCTTIN